MRKTPPFPLCLFSESHDFIATASPRPRTERVSDGAMIPSSQLKRRVRAADLDQCERATNSRADAKSGVDSCSICSFSFDVFAVSLRGGVWGSKLSVVKEKRGKSHVEIVAITSCSWSPPITETLAFGHIHMNLGEYLHPFASVHDQR